MATYVISDIHGNLDVFKELLKTIDFKYDGTDQLYLLGDYVDWGPKSLETLFFVMELTQKYPFITALLGNHDLMFLEQIEGYKKDKWYRDSNWLYSNGGDKTWAEYLQLEEDEKVKVQEYLENLPFVTDIIVGDKKYLAAHACPVHKFEYDELLSERENDWAYYDSRFRAVWERIQRKVCYVIRWFDDEGIYNNFICGHTISHYVNDGHFSIIVKENDYINIDCGAKILGKYEYDEEQYARLACLRLDDFEEFYQDIKEEQI